MNSFALSVANNKTGVSVAVVLRDRFLVVHEAGGWRVYSTCDCLLSTHYWPTKRAALEGLFDFLAGVEEKHLRKANIDARTHTMRCEKSRFSVPNTGGEEL